MAVSHTAHDQGASNPHYPTAAVSWYATFTLAFLYWMSLLDRFIISLLIDPIKADLGLTDVQFGLLQGLAFTLSFTVFGFIFGALADRNDRRKLIYIGITVWSLASAACGLATTFWQMLLARSGLGAGEASLNPSATSMISDLFPRDRQTSAMAVYSVGSTIGSGTALMIGGAIIYWVSGLGDIILPVIGPVATWQAVFLIVGLPGVVIAFIVFTFPEPVRRGSLSTKQVKKSWLAIYRDMYDFISIYPRFFACHYIGFTMGAAVLFGSAAWFPVHMIRSFGWSEGRIGLYLGTIILISGIIGKLLCGFLVDHLYRRGRRDAQMRWYSISLFAATPLGIAALMSQNPISFLCLIAAFVIFITPMYACSLTALNLVTPNHLRGTGIAIFTTMASLVGGSGGTLLIPVFSNLLFQGEGSIGLGIATLIAIACPAGGVMLAVGLSAMRQAISDADIRYQTSNA